MIMRTKLLLLGGSTLALLLFGAKKAGAATQTNGGGGGGNQVHRDPIPGRPKGPFPGAPPGSGTATVAPYVAPGDPAKYGNGLLVHSSPNSSPATLVAPEDSSATSRHANTGDVVAIVRMDVPDESNPKTGRLWAEIFTPLGQRGFVSQKGPNDPAIPGFPNVSNFSNVVPPQGVAVAGAYPRYRGRHHVYPMHPQYRPAVAYRSRFGG